MNRFCVALVVVFSVMGPGFAPVVNAAPALDKEYKLINPPQPVTGKGVEVLEFFNYACSHCYEFEPSLKTWLKNRPKDVEFRYVPAVFNERMLPLAKIYYALEEMGLVEKMHDKVYFAIHQQQVNLADRAAMMKWISEQGVDAGKYEGVYESFGVANKAQRSVQMTRNYRVPGTPYVIVNGRYLTGPSMTLGSDGNVNQGRFGQVLNELIEMSRSRSK